MLQNGNSKMVSTAKANNCLCYSFSLPAGNTCPRAGVCKAYCYAQCGPMAWKPSISNAQNNFTQTTMPDFVNTMIGELLILSAKAKKQGKQLVVRLHDSGDFYSQAYLTKWITIMGYFPEVTFYCYTKSHVMLKTVEQCLPDNFYYIPSAGGLDDPWLKDKPHAKVVTEDYKLLPNERWGDDEDDIANVLMVHCGYTICLRAHGARKGKVK